MISGFASRFIIPAQVVLLALLTFYQLFQLHAPVQQVVPEQYEGRPILSCEGKGDDVSNSALKKKIASMEPAKIVPRSISKEPRTQQKLPQKFIENSFAACLIIQDDNHLLAEWLTYHYHVLPLRRLIVGIDPRSITSPTSILDRFRKEQLIEITEWQEEDFMMPEYISVHNWINESDPKQLQELYIERQFQFYGRCMAILRNENASWAAIMDTDEYILPNPRASADFLQKDTKNKTILEILQDPQGRLAKKSIRSGCVSMHRLQFGHKESNFSAVQSMVPHGFNGSDFTTMRWRYHADRTNKEANKPAKCMVNLQKAVDADFVHGEINAHRPIKRLCSYMSMYIRNADSPFVGHHYSGSWNQWNYRNDFRPKRLRHNFDRLYFDNPINQDDTVRPWLQDFVRRHGHELASYLLDGVGQLEPKPSST